MSAPPSRMNSQIANVMNSSGRREGELVYMSVGHAINEKIVKALSLFKQSFEGAILVQVWAPLLLGDQLVLSTYHQPSFTPHQQLSGYRDVSKKFTFSTDIKDISRLGLPGRVFTSGVPEWTSNIIYYKKEEYLRADHAVEHKVRGSIAIPIFLDYNMSCSAVLEIVTEAEKQNFHAEMESVCREIEAVDLRTKIPSPIVPPHQHSSGIRGVVLAEIANVLRGTCHTHKLPLGLTWIPCSSSTKSTRKDILCLDNRCCYVNADEFHGFVQACSENYLKEGQGAAGWAYMLHRSSFFKNVKILNISCYPVVQHARKFDLSAAAAIGLRSIYTGDEEYIIEFFLPSEVKDSLKQNSLLTDISVTMRSLSLSLREVTGAESVHGVEGGLKIDPTTSELQPRFSTTVGSSTASSASSRNIAKRSRCENNPRIIIKAMYRNDTIRFHFEPTAGCSHLYEEVGARFELYNGMFQLQYLDEENEWIRLINDSDLKECLDSFNAPFLRIRVCYL